MNESIFCILPVLFPILAGILLLLLKPFGKRKYLMIYTGIVLCMTALLVLTAVMQGSITFTAFYLTKTLPVIFKIDEVSRLFVLLVSLIWVSCGFFSFEYMKHDTEEKRFYGYYMILYGILAGLDFSGNLITFYIFYELMTLASVPLVLHTRTKESIMAGLKYLFYSLAGAYMVLFGLYILHKYANTLTFSPGGTLNLSQIEGKEGLLLLTAFLMILGFGVKAGSFPLHAWLPTAHPAAPAPASAALSGIIVKSGILGMIRVVYDLFGVDFLKDTWVQTVWIVLSLITVFMGSMLAYMEKGFKKRLAYSTVSNLSYIMFGLALLNPIGMQGALYHVVFHAIVKCGLFLFAGAVIVKTGRTQVAQLSGIGKIMPLATSCFTVFSLALIGIPPTSGFLSKWFLLLGSLENGQAWYRYAGPAILLISALLTAGYLLPISIKGFLPEKEESEKKVELSPFMSVPLLVLAFLAVFFGIFPGSLNEFIHAITVLIF